MDLRNRWFDRNRLFIYLIDTISLFKIELQANLTPFFTSPPTLTWTVYRTARTFSREKKACLTNTVRNDFLSGRDLQKTFAMMVLHYCNIWKVHSGACSSLMDLFDGVSDVRMQALKWFVFVSNEEMLAV